MGLQLAVIAWQYTTSPLDDLFQGWRPRKGKSAPALRFSPTTPGRRRKALQCGRRTIRDGCELTRSCPKNVSNGCNHGRPRAPWVGAPCVGVQGRTPGRCEGRSLHRRGSPTCCNPATMQNHAEQRHRRDKTTTAGGVRALNKFLIGVSSKHLQMTMGLGVELEAANIPAIHQPELRGCALGLSGTGLGARRLAS